MNKLTLEKIAQLAGVSRSTVSRVVNGHPSVKPEVRRRVQQVIDETGYHPDPAARSLAGQRSGIIGLVIPRAFQFLFTDPYYPRLMQGIAQACNTHNYILSLFLFHTEEEEKKLTPKLLRQQFVDGVILSALPTDDPLIPQLIQNEVPTVMIGRPAEALPVSYIDVSNIDGAFEAVSYLLELGANRIATINGPQNTMVGLDRFQGGDMHGGRDDIIAGLPLIHMIVGMHRSTVADLAAQDLIGPVGYHFVGVHVGGGAGAGLENVQHKMGVQLAVDYLLSRFHNSVTHLAVQPFQRHIGLRRRQLDHAHGANKAPGEA